MTPYQVECMGCGIQILRVKNVRDEVKNFKCFDCKKKHKAVRWRTLHPLSHKTVHTSTIENN